jgi:hypothetical protein
MDIYITKNNSRSGPFTEDQVREMIATAKVSKKDAAWHEGLVEWVALGEIIKDSGQSTTSVPSDAQVGFVISKRTFRIIVGLSLIFLIAQIVSSFVCSLPEPLQTYNDTRYNSASTIPMVLLLVTYVLLLCLLVASYVGLFLIHKWGKLLFSIAVGIGVFLTLCQGPDVETAFSDSCGSLFDMTNGVILSIAYLTPLFKTR